MDNPTQKVILVDASDRCHLNYIKVHGNGNLYTMTNDKEKATIFTSEEKAMLFARTKINTMKAKTLQIEFLEEPKVKTKAVESVAEPEEVEAEFVEEMPTQSTDDSNFNESLDLICKAIKLCPSILTKTCLIDHESEYNFQQQDLLHAIENSGTWKLNAVKMNTVVKRLKTAREMRRKIKLVLQSIIRDEAVNMSPRYAFRSNVLSDIITDENIDCTPEYLK